MNVAEVLEKAADLIEPKGRWTQGSYARDVNGAPAFIGDGNAVCYCAVGSIIHTVGNWPGSFRAIDALGDAIRANNIAKWNDSENRTQAEVVAKLRQAASHARKDA